jgi:hypothetical protein
MRPLVRVLRFAELSEAGFEACDGRSSEACKVGVDVKVIITPPCIFCMDDH